MRKIFSLLILLCVCLSFLTVDNSLSQANAVTTLQLVLTTDKTTYNVGDSISISSNVTRDGTQITDALVAIEVNLPNSDSYAIRTVQTGEIPPQTWPVEITTLYPCDSYGNPKNLFEKGEFLYIKIIFKNNSPAPKNVKAPIYIQYSNNVPFKAYYLPAYIEAGLEVQIIISMPIPDYAISGEATIFASAYSELPKNLGGPYCPEKKASFYIDSTSPPTQPQPQFSNITFALPKTNAWLGVYVIHGSATQQQDTTMTTRTFNVTLIGDINNDLIVETRDVSIVCRAYGKTPSDPGWNPKADLNNDNLIDTRDVSTVCRNYGKSGILSS